MHDAQTPSQGANYPRKYSIKFGSIFSNYFLQEAPEEREVPGTGIGAGDGYGGTID